MATKRKNQIDTAAEKAALSCWMKLFHFLLNHWGKLLSGGLTGAGIDELVRWIASGSAPQ